MMLSLPKIKRITDEKHLEYVRRQSCLECQGVALSLDPRMTSLRKRMCDPHHLRNTTHPRRFFDWLTVPLCRFHHGQVDTPDGPEWERRNWTRLIRVAGNLLYRNGRITGKRFDALIRCGDNEERVREWIDLLIADGQNWGGGTI